MGEIDFDKIKSELLDFTKKEVNKFLSNQKEKRFYAFAYDCNADSGEVNLCFNTEEDFLKTLAKYQNGKYSEYYQNETEIYDLRYNTGDWEFQAFSSINIPDTNELSKIEESMQNDEEELDYEKWDELLEKLMTIYTEVLKSYSKTEDFSRIPKTDDFKILCIDHDEEILDAEIRLKQLLTQS